MFRSRPASVKFADEIEWDKPIDEDIFRVRESNAWPFQSVCDAGRDSAAYVSILKWRKEMYAAIMMP
jgi:hypothetical protein